MLNKVFFCNCKSMALEVQLAGVYPEGCEALKNTEVYTAKLHIIAKKLNLIVVTAVKSFKENFIKI